MASGSTGACPGIAANQRLADGSTGHTAGDVVEVGERPAPCQAVAFHLRPRRALLCTRRDTAKYDILSLKPGNGRHEPAFSVTFCRV